jgi:hypothetical protein
MGYKLYSLMFPDRKPGKDRDPSMLLGWYKKGEEQSNGDEQGYDEASAALLPKNTDDELFKAVTARDDEAEDEASIIGETEYRKSPWWSWIWVRLRFCLTKIRLINKDIGLRSHTPPL